MFSFLNGAFQSSRYSSLCNCSVTHSIFADPGSVPLPCGMGLKQSHQTGPTPLGGQSSARGQSPTLYSPFPPISVFCHSSKCFETFTDLHSSSRFTSTYQATFQPRATLRNTPKYAIVQRLPSLILSGVNDSNGKSVV